MLYAIFPFVSAALYGLGYVLMERIFKTVPILSYMVCNSIIFTLILGVLAFTKRQNLSFDFLYDRKMLGLFIIALGVNAIAWVFTLTSLKMNSSSYTAFAEISYPLFVLLFLYLFFGVHQWNMHSLCGGILILAGSAIMLSAQVSIKNQ